MTGDDDLNAVLPEPPPPAPKPRDAAIAAALARFDGVPAPARTRRPGSAPWWKTPLWPQAGLITATALVVAISLPFTWRPPISPVPTAGEGGVPGTNNAMPSGKQAPGAAPAATPPVPPPSAKADAAAPSPSDNAIAMAQPPDFAPPAPASPPAPLAMREEESAPIVVQGRAVSQSLQDTPVAVSVVSSEEISRDEGSIIVTSSRKSRNKPVGRGDWNACTVNDPSRALTRCRKLADKVPRAVRSQAETHLSDGLKQAWSGQLDKAIVAFDAAITVAPDLTAAYLNRGLVHDLQGNSEAAIADLNRAVRLSPKSARAYYNRSVLLRKHGYSRRADADEQQAINLDPRYQAILR